VPVGGNHIRSADRDGSGYAKERIHVIRNVPQCTWLSGANDRWTYQQCGLIGMDLIVDRTELLAGDVAFGEVDLRPFPALKYSGSNVSRRDFVARDPRQFEPLLKAAIKGD